MDYKKFMDKLTEQGLVEVEAPLKHHTARVSYHKEGDPHRRYEAIFKTTHNGGKEETEKRAKAAFSAKKKIVYGIVHEQVVTEGVDILTRSDYKLDKAGKKSHKEIVFHNGDGDQEKDDKLKREEIEIEEKLDPSMGAGEYIKDFQKSDAPQFKGKSKEKKRMMGIAAYMAAKKGMKEEVELAEAAPFKTLDQAVAHATDKVKTHRDNLDGIEVYKHKSGGYDVNHTMNSSGRNSLSASGAKHLGTVYKDKPANIKEEAENIEEAESHQSKTTMKHIPNASPALKKAAKDIKPGVSGYRDRIAMLKAGGVKEETVAEAKDEQEYGYEGDMAMTQLETAIRHATHLKDMMEPDTDLPEWVQSKITLATDYLQTACDYMTSEMNEALKGNQHKIDKNKNGKVDAHDFKLLRKEEAIDEAMINGREYASHGLMHPDHAAHAVHKVTGSTIDFYAHGSGDKVSGKVTKNDGKAVHIKDTSGKTHQFKVTPHLPKQQNEEVDLEENAPIAPSLVKHRIGVTVSDPNHTMVSKRKEKIQKFVNVTHSSNKEGAQKVGEKFYKKKGYVVHDSHHAGMVNEEVVNEESTAYEKSEENKRSADSAKKTGDMFAHHLHMADHHDNLAQWHSEKGRHAMADSHAEKSEKHHEKAMALKEGTNFDEEGNLMAEKKSYSQFMEQLLEYESDKEGVYRHTKGSYGKSYDSEDDDKPSKAEPSAVKRGRGRPAGAKSGANQKVSSGKSYGGIATHTLNLPK
jgi:hypothetical protein